MRCQLENYSSTKIDLRVPADSVGVNEVIYNIQLLYNYIIKAKNTLLSLRNLNPLLGAIVLIIAPGFSQAHVFKKGAEVQKIEEITT